MKKLWIACICCCLCAGTAYAKDVYYEKFTDSKTGRQIEYFDLNEDTTRTYFTQNAWFSDSKSFIISSKPEQQIYKYDILSHSVTALFSPACLPLDNAAVVGPDDTVYAVNHTDGNLYAQQVDLDKEQEEISILSMTLPFNSGYDDATASSSSEAGTDSEGSDYTENGLTFRFCNNNRWRRSTTVARKRGDKYCRATVMRNTQGSMTRPALSDFYDWNVPSGNRLSSQMLFKVDNSMISTSQRDITIEFDYFGDTNSDQSSIELKYLKYNDGGTPTVATKFVTMTKDNAWHNAKVILTDAQFDKSAVDSNNLNDGNGRYYDFQIGMGGNRGGFASTWVKVYPTPANDITNLGDKKGGWHPHVSINGDLSLTTGDNKKIVIYEANNSRFATTDVWIKSSHAIINPMYPHLVLYCEDGNTSDTTNARIRVFNRNTMYKGALFVQYKNSSGGETTGEAVGHESWSGNGEYVVAVKYVKDTNVGKNGIIRMDKNGENREYINDDYDYWHCAANYDGRWIVADTEPVSDITNIVLIDAKTGKSYLVARQKTFLVEEGQSHPTFSPDGTKITFGIARRKLNSSDENYVIGAAIVDVSDIVNDGQIAEPTGLTDFSLSPFSVGFNKDLGRNEVRATVDNIDGETRDMTLYSAVFDEDGRMVSANKSRYYSTADETIATEIEDVDKGQTLKFFLWDDNKNPVGSSVDTIRQLHAAKVGANEIVLSWQHETDMPVLKYEVYRGNQKIGETEIGRAHV